MRIIKFRGMTLVGQWVFGNLAYVNKKRGNCVDPGFYISNSAGSPFAYDVRPETVGQFTGIYDQNKKEIYEGDLIETKSSVGIAIHGEVIFEDGSFVAHWGYKNPPKGGRTDYFMSARLNSSWRVVGNAHDIAGLSRGDL